jgi:O-antigen/teichoic acid export membrane protein
VLVNSTQNVIKQTFAGLGQYRRCNLAHLLPQLLHLIALLSIVPIAVMTSRYAALALFVSGFVAVLTMLPKFIRAARPQIAGSFSELRRLVSYSGRAALMDCVNAIASYADRLVLIPLLPASQLGFYAVAFSFSRVVQFVQPAIMSVMLAHLSGQTESAGKRLHDTACRFLLAGLLIGCALLWVAGERLLVITYGVEFAAATTVFRLLVIEASLATLSQVTAQFFLSRDRPGVVSTIQVIVLGVSIVALFTLVPRYGVAGAAVGLLGAGLIRWLLLLGALKQVLKLSLPRLYPSVDDLQFILRRLR